MSDPVVVNTGGYGPFTITGFAADGSGSADLFRLLPTDCGVGKPFFVITKVAGDPDAYSMGLWDGVGNAGIVYMNALFQFSARPTWNGVGLATVNEIDGGTLTPDQFGAAGNNYTPDTQAFRNMFAAVGSRGAKIYIPPKPYYVDDDLVITKHGLDIQCSPSHSSSVGTLLRFAPNKGVKFDGASGCRWRDGYISGGVGSDPSNGKALLTLGTLGLGGNGSGCVRNLFEGLEVDGGYRAMHIGNSLSTRFRHCRFVGSTGTEVVLMGNGSDAVWGVDNPEFTNCNFGGKPGDTNTDVIRMKGKVHGPKFTDCPIVFGNHGIVLDRASESSSHPKFITISGGGFENGHGHAMRVLYGDDIRLNHMYASTDGSLDGFYLAESFDGVIRFTNSTIRGNGRDGIRYMGGRLSVDNCDIVNNGFKTTGDGIRIHSTAVSDFVITNNRFGPAKDGVNRQRYGIYNGARAGAGIISNNNSNTGNPRVLIGGRATGPGISNNV